MYIRAALRGVDPKNVSIELDAKNGTVIVSGFKLPSERDLAMERLTATPNYGRFIIRQHVSPHLVDLDEMDYRLSRDSTLIIRIPKRLNPYHSFYGRPTHPFRRNPFGMTAKCY